MFYFSKRSQSHDSSFFLNITLASLTLVGTIPNVHDHNYTKKLKEM